MLDFTVGRYPCGQGEDVLVFFHDLIHLLVLHSGTLHGGYGCGHDLPLTLGTNKKENKYLGLRDDLTVLLSKDQRDGSRQCYLSDLV